MYESFYGLKEKPFNLLPDPDYLFMSQGHDNAYTHLEYALAENKGFVVITGEIGSGKTTLINFFLRKIQQNIRVGLINNTYVHFPQFIKLICQEFELDVEGIDRAKMLDLFYDFLLRQFTKRKRVVLIIDEAQNLSPEAMEEIRMLSNLESEKHHLIQMILVGQPDLKHKLRRRDLEQFTQRVTVHCHIDCLSSEETEKYIQYRLKVGGAQNPDLFHSDAIKAVYKYSGGIPRLINILCDSALVHGYADGIKFIDKKIIENVVKEREAGGIFFRDSLDEERIPSISPFGGDISGEMEKREAFLAERLCLLENMMGRFDQRLNNLANASNERDTIVIELFKMLKESMESRIETLFQFYRFRRKTEMDQRKSVKGETGPPLSLFSRLKRKKGSP